MNDCRQQNVASNFSRRFHGWSTHCMSSCCRMFGNGGGKKHDGLTIGVSSNVPFVYLNLY